ncbi:hypothetical protein C8A03DRAFT_46677 [Achaetomium macrosporum]|uniref:Uncharacterized protein n=1 Tax=Achaetomium macrosporum TaxID=79813 RepID=A0AAN7H955_9PEZI|nr:hypothetical protein C8A03DRAFT_46677 [Achaetomium macrosporum]
MESSQHVGAINELDLSACQPDTLVGRINAVPGLKTSAAFLTFLRANLVLTHSPMSSNVSTPSLGPQPSQDTQGISDSDIPPLSLEILTARADKAAALRLIADSIAQQRQQAASHLVFHPLPLSGLLAVLAAIYRYAWVRNGQHDLGTTLLLASGAIMTYLLAIRYLTSGYLRAAEELSWDFLTPGASNGQGGQEDLIIGTRFGSEIIGALVLRLERLSSSDGNHGHGRRKSHSRQNSLKGGRGVIRAWTTKLRYRRRGVGGDMLREAVRVARERCGKDAEVGFAKEHANSVMVLPERFNGVFRKREMRAARTLDELLSKWDGRTR